MQKLFLFFINKPLYMKLLFVVMFVLYGAIISTISYSITKHYQAKNTKTKVLEAQKQSFKIKTTNLKIKMDGFVSNLYFLRQSLLFNEYLQTKNLDYKVLDLFKFVMSTNKDLSQLRYIDENGFEKIRYDRSKINDDYITLKTENLQNKSSRYYFKEIKEKTDGLIWYSKLDLNMEHGVIEKPIVPTLRIGTPVYEGDAFKGIVIMNIFFEQILKDFVDSSFFNISIFDVDGEFIHNKIEKDSKVIDNSWSRYLNKEYNLYKYNEYLIEISKEKGLNDYYISQSISPIIPNQDQLSVFYEPNILKLKEIEENERNYIYTVTLIVLFLSLPLALIISIIPNMLNEQLFQTKKRLEKEIKVIDEYVYLSITDIDGYILDVSQAYCDLTGYTKEELIGNKHSVLKHQDTESSTYKDLWNTILNKKVWQGELKNKKKDGTLFNAKVLIKPTIDSDSKISAFTAYVQDITYQKEVERISVTDELTKLYNRREFNRIFEISVENAKRYKNPFAMMILDIDFFKQYNDTYGHLMGDEALYEIAKVIKQKCKRTTDMGFRLGGEEFAIVFSSSSKADAYRFACDINEAVSELQIEHKGSKINKHVTISIGVFFSDNIQGFSKEELYQRSDDALYFAKDKGRNQVYMIDSQY